MRTLNALLAAVLALGVATPAHAVPRTGWLLLSRATGQPSPHVDSRLLLCGPDGGTHPAAAIACGQLRRAGGRVERIPEEPGPCTLEFNLTTVTARGWWTGGYRTFRATYANPCTSVRDTGGVLFDW